MENFSDKLSTWLNENKVINPEIYAYLQNWLKEGLKEWDISRDGPYFGFPIPGEENKFFYVWLDAPIGYISISEIAAKSLNKNYQDYWQDQNTEIIHFIGKDIVYFHTLFWPSLLMSANYTLPKKIFVHGMLTVNGEKMSKSRGTFILADKFAQHINPEALRYYFACKLSTNIEDIDLNFDDFMSRVNSDLVNKSVNVISRALPLLHKFFAGKACASLDENADILIKETQNTVLLTKKYFLSCETAKAINAIIRLSEQANKYLQDNQPWKLIDSDKNKAHQIITTGLYVGKVCFALLKPVLPISVKKLELMLNDDQEFDFENILDDLSKKNLRPYEHLFSRIEESAIKNLFTSTQEKETKIMNTNFINFEHFAKVELRAAKIIDVKDVENSDKLISFKLDVGELGEKHIFAGLKQYLDLSDLVGKTLVIVANLEPRKMRFGVSEGMILAVGEEKPQPIFLSNAKPGDLIR